MNLHTVVVSYNRPELLERTVESYRATVTVPYTLLIVDNGSNTDTRHMIRKLNVPCVQLHANHYPGYACNVGFWRAPPYASYLHRSDNDMEYLPGWCQEVERMFANPKVGQVGLRTAAEELHTELNVGGTAVFRAELWEEGLRYRTDSWAKLGAFTEDYWISQDLVERGYKWRRVRRPCVVHLASGDLADPYYQESFGVRGLLAES